MPNRPVAPTYANAKRAERLVRGQGIVGGENRSEPHVRDRRYRARVDLTGRGVLYLAADLGTALAEAYPGQWPDVARCPHTRAAWVRPSARARLLDLTASGAIAIGAVGTLAWGDEPRTRPQWWGRRIYEQYERLDGIRYRAAHQGGGPSPGPAAARRSTQRGHRLPRPQPAHGRITTSAS
jgi:hypothetical protein